MTRVWEGGRAVQGDVLLGWPYLQHRTEVATGSCGLASVRLYFKTSLPWVSVSERQKASRSPSGALPFPVSHWSKSHAFPVLTPVPSSQEGFAEARAYTTSQAVPRHGSLPFQVVALGYGVVSGSSRSFSGLASKLSLVHTLTNQSQRSFTTQGFYFCTCEQGTLDYDLKDFIISNSLMAQTSFFIPTICLPILGTLVS